MWSAFVLATIAVPALLPALGGVIPRRRGISKRSHARAVGRDLVLAASQVGLTLTMLAHQAWLMTDAIVRTLVRVYVTRRSLLEWVTAAQAKAGLRLDLSGFYRRMAGSRRARRRRGHRGGVGTAGGLARRAALSPAVGRGARGGSLDQPAPDASRPPSRSAGGRAARSG